MRGALGDLALRRDAPREAETQYRRALADERALALAEAGERDELAAGIRGRLGRYRAEAAGR